MFHSYYACYCGGTFYVDMLAKSYNAAPCLYNYACDRCGKRKTMPCREEVESLRKHLEASREKAEMQGELF